MSHLIVNGVDKTLDHIKIKAIVKGLSEPLCGIGTYKDPLDLSTGVLTRYVKKLVLTGQETVYSVTQNISQNAYCFGYKYSDLGMSDIINYNELVYTIPYPEYISSHFKMRAIPTAQVMYNDLVPGEMGANSWATTQMVWMNQYLVFCTDSCSTADEFKQYLAAQYAAGTPVTVYYILASPATEQITVPSGLTGTIEGYLTQTGTPTPTNPIYPTANGEEESGGTYSIDTGEYIEAWEARDKFNHLLWGRADTFTGTNSISARCYGLPVKSWEIDGNSQQTGTPTPDNPVYPEFVGDRTENLVTEIRSTNGWRPGYMQGGVYNPTNTNGEWLSPFISTAGITEFTISAKSVPASPSMSVYWFNGDTYITASSGTVYTGQTFAVRENATRFCFAIRTFDDTEAEIVTDGFWVMLNTGSTAKPYEPYGYKLSVTSAGQTVSVYLGQVPTLRRIKKLVLTGQETDGFVSSGRGYIRVRDGMQETIAPYSDKLLGVTTPASESPDFSVKQLQTNFQYVISTALLIKSNVVFTYFSDFQNWLRENAPITVWYVLATPQTGIVNEPLAKIGAYTDTLTSEQAGITIPTTNGNNTISIDTSLAPSRFEIKVHAKPL